MLHQYAVVRTDQDAPEFLNEHNRPMPPSGTPQRNRHVALPLPLIPRQGEFEKCLEIDAQDKAAATFFARIVLFKEKSPREDWEGIWTFAEK